MRKYRCIFFHYPVHTENIQEAAMNDLNAQLQVDFAHLARIALAGREQDVQLFLHKTIKRYGPTNPSLATSLSELLREAPTRASPLRRQAEAPLPVDIDSRLKLLRIEASPTFDHKPVFAPKVLEGLQQLLSERRSPQALHEAGLEPTKTALFTGPPGVGKTMAARWVAAELRRPLLTLDLAAVMSSYLGRTGSNLRYVLDYAKDTECVLLLDELDAIAKRRDDNGEIGELKRLVTVLIQEIDDWPSSGLLIAATNHPDLLDPAIWRRFEMVLKFPLPDNAGLLLFISDILKDRLPDAEAWASALSLGMAGKSYSEVERLLLSARRDAALNRKMLGESLEQILKDATLTKSELISLATALTESGLFSQRKVQEMTGIARETIRSRINKSGTERKKR